MSDIFISYARSTAKEAQQVAEALRAQGYRVWRDSQIPAHRSYADVIAEHLQAAKAVVVVWSAEAARSEWVRSEAEGARAGHKLVQLRIDDAKLPMPFDQIECADLVDWSGDPGAPGWRKVLASVAELMSARIDLAQEPDFRLGDLLVSPSAARVRTAAGDQRVEPRVMEVLLVLVRHVGRTVTRDQLIEACWGGRVVSDDAVTRVVAQVRALGRSIEPAPFVLETVPKVGFRLTPADASGGDPGDPRPAAPASSHRASKPGATRPRLAIAAATALLALAIGAALVWRFANPAPTQVPGQNGRVDVMMFTPEQPDPALQKVAAEVPESIVRMLSGAGVQVAARPVPRDAAGSDAELRVAGTVGRDKTDYVINAQILDRRSGLVLWTDRLVRTTQEQEASPGEVGDAIAAILHCALADRKPARTALSTEAFGLYLNVCAAIFVDGSASRMLAVTRRLVKIAPEFAGAHAMHSIAAALAAQEIEHSPSEAAALHAEAKAAAELALKIDPHAAKAYSGLALNEGALGDQLTQNRLLEERYLLAGLKLDPDLPPARNEYATLLRGAGRINEALEFIRHSDQSDPRSGGDPRVALLLAATGDLEGAEEILKKMEVGSRVSQNGVRLAIAFWWEDPKKALPKIRALAAGNTSPERVACYEQYLAELDARRAAKARGLPASCDFRRVADANWRVRMLAREGDVDGAFAALKGRIPGGTLLFYYPEMKSVRRDPRFWPLAARYGLADYWLKSGHWPDFCAEPDLPYDCKTAAQAAARPAVST